MPSHHADSHDYDVCEFHDVFSLRSKKIWLKISGSYFTGVWVVFAIALHWSH